MVWNPTIANLTLMALGSSAPEILLSVIETITTLGATPGELGPSTIVGSAAFNLMVISAVSIISVTPESEKIKDERDESIPLGVKKINDTGVFAVTAIFSLIAYIWMWVVLEGVSPMVVEVWEAVITLILFVVLCVLAYIADKCNEAKMKKIEEETLRKKATEYSQAKKEHEIQTGEHHVAKKELINVDFTPLDVYNILIKEKREPEKMSEAE